MQLITGCLSVLWLLNTAFCFMHVRLNRKLRELNWDFSNDILNVCMKRNMINMTRFSCQILVLVHVNPRAGKSSLFKRRFFPELLYNGDMFIIIQSYFVHTTHRWSLHSRAGPTTLIRYQAHIALFNTPDLFLFPPSPSLASLEMRLPR